jgi:hypothetical protein
LSPKLVQRRPKKSYISFHRYQPRWMAINQNSGAARENISFWKLGFVFFKLFPKFGSEKNNQKKIIAGVSANFEKMKKNFGKFFRNFLKKIFRNFFLFF